MRFATGLLVAGSLLAAPAISNAAGFRWPWEGRSTPSKATPTPAPIPTPAPAATPAPNAGPEESGESSFLQSTHNQLQQWIADGDLAASRASQPAVKSFGRTLAAQCRQMDAQIVDREKAVGISTTATRPGGALGNVLGQISMPGDATLNGKTGLDFDDSFLTKVIESNESFLPGFATFKENEGNHPFHATLVQQFDTMKQQREQAHSLLDQTHAAERQQVRGTTK